MMSSTVIQEYRYILRLLLLNKRLSLSELRNVRKYYIATKKYQNPVICNNMLHSVRIFLSNETEYRRLMDLYNPLNQLTKRERISKTANHVGLKVPE
ncbi:Fmc1p PWA37_003497 [Arxiozyma heterogenica]